MQDQLSKGLLNLGLNWHLELTFFFLISLVKAHVHEAKHLQPRVAVRIIVESSWSCCLCSLFSPRKQLRELDGRPENVLSDVRFLMFADGCLAERAPWLKTLGGKRCQSHLHHFHFLSQFFVYEVEAALDGTQDAVIRCFVVFEWTGMWTWEEKWQKQAGCDIHSFT